MMLPGDLILGIPKRGTEIVIGLDDRSVGLEPDDCLGVIQSFISGSEFGVRSGDDFHVFILVAVCCPLGE